MGFFKKAAVATAMATAVVTMVGQGGAFGASAAAGGAVGTGTIAPGLPTTGCANQTSVTFDSFVLVYTDTAPTVSTANTHFAGASNGCETLNAGQGSGTLSGGLSGWVDYVRIKNVVAISGTINGTAAAGACLFVPTSVNPVTSYALACVVSS